MDHLLAPPGPWAPLEAPAGLGDLAELDGPWAHAAHRAAVAVLAGGVGDAHTWTPWGYPPPAAYRGRVPSAGPPINARPHPGPVAVPAPRAPRPTAPTAPPAPSTVAAAFRRPAPTTPMRAVAPRPAPTPATTPAFPAAAFLPGGA